MFSEICHDIDKREKGKTLGDKFQISAYIFSFLLTLNTSVNEN